LSLRNNSKKQQAIAAKFAVNSKLLLSTNASGSFRAQEIFGFSNLKYHVIMAFFGYLMISGAQVD
jgi:hypothetical protein